MDASSSIGSNRGEGSVAKARFKVAELTKRVCEIEDAIKTAETQEKEAKRIARSSLRVLLYLKMAHFLRTLTSCVFEWRWAGVLIGSACIGAAFFVTAMSWKDGAFGFVLASFAFLVIFYVPAEPDLSQRILETRNKWEATTNNYRKYMEVLASMRNEIAANKHELKKLEAFQSSAVRRQGLLRRDWKSLRSVPFENFLEEVFKELDYVVETTKVTGDQGADLIVAKGGHRIAIQVKGYFNSVSNSAVQEAYTANGYYTCDGCAVVTNSRFTPSARDLATKIGCVLIDEVSLPSLITGACDLWQLHLSAAAQTQPSQQI